MRRDAPDALARPLRLAPHLTERPWGGGRLRTDLGKDAPPDIRFGESWELSDHPHGRSRVELPDGSLMPLGELFRRWPMEALALDEAPAGFPLLVKFLDAREDLSLQVHPDDAWCAARGHGDRGKSECWYVIEADPGAEAIVGLAPGTGPEALRRAVEARDFSRALRRVPIRPGTFIDVPAGTVHAILGGTLLCEVQQSSDTTFRIWDWDRKPQRGLHLEDALSATRWEAEEPRLLRLPPRPAREGVVERGLVANGSFSVVAVDVPPFTEAALRYPRPAEAGATVCVVGGSGEWTGGPPMPLGSAWFLPACLEAPLHLRAGSAGMRLLAVEAAELKPPLR
ncbi:MAG: type I phosphomannose isomerase catalytic subunit [Candidatus Sumerlaeia bacterium]|nr:type I phosphomannose isomerase catalytic subunit [Candidatus Sumerlaeia bacterium]